MTIAKVLPELSGNLIEDEREFLHRRHDDLLTLLDELAKVAGMFGVPHRRVVGPADVAALAVHIMSNTALTGATYDIDGGQQLVS